MADLFSLSKTIFLSIWKQQALIFHITKIQGKNSLKETETRYRVSTPTSTHEGACSWNRLVQQNCPWSLLPRIKPVWYEGAKPGSKSFVEQHSFSLKIVGADEGALLRELVARSSLWSPRHGYHIICPGTSFSWDVVALLNPRKIFISLETDFNTHHLGTFLRYRVLRFPTILFLFYDSLSSYGIVFNNSLSTLVRSYGIVFHDSLSTLVRSYVRLWSLYSVILLTPVRSMLN